ncbi:MAG: glycosyltransferase family 4 protein [Planctomycetota bacterium]|jgi:glycosyltransferase involved in cell wall biosynthesis
MAKSAAKKVVFISSFPPRKCGIATFTSDLVKNASAAAKGEFEPLLVAMRSEDHKYEDPVKFEIRQNVKSDYICAADYINLSHVDAVSIQHEFGLFGGDAGAYLSLLLDRLEAPIITTLHTVLDDPSPPYHKSLVDVCRASHRVITMNERGVAMLRDVYGVPARKIKLIAHGIPDLPFVDSNYYKHEIDLEDRKTILTFGLLNENKGIEVMLEAMPAIVKAEPSVIYIVLGMTHPNVLRHQGESYRFGLQQMVKDLGLQEHVIFHNRFVDDEELHNFLCAADIYVTPYLSPKQLTSGTLSFAVGAGKAVVSTPYWAATELLADGRGKLVRFAGNNRNTSRRFAVLFAAKKCIRVRQVQNLAEDRPDLLEVVWRKKNASRHRRKDEAHGRRDHIEHRGAGTVAGPFAEAHRRHRHVPARQMYDTKSRIWLLHGRQRQGANCNGQVLRPAPRAAGSQASRHVSVLYNALAKR